MDDLTINLRGVVPPFTSVQLIPGTLDVQRGVASASIVLARQDPRDISQLDITLDGHLDKPTAQLLNVLAARYGVIVAGLYATCAEGLLCITVNLRDGAHDPFLALLNLLKGRGDSLISGRELNEMVGLVSEGQMVHPSSDKLYSYLVIQKLEELLLIAVNDTLRGIASVYH